MAERKLNWYVGFTKSCQEKKVAEVLTAMGVEHYLPIQKVRRKWSDRIKVIDKLVIPHMIFIFTDQDTRVKLLPEINGLTGYMSKGGPWNPIVVPERQMNDFRFMVENASDDVLFEQNPLKPGDPIEVLVGPLAGMRGELIKTEKGEYVAIRLMSMGAAMVKVSLNSIRRYDPEKDEPMIV